MEGDLLYLQIVAAAQTLQITIAMYLLYNNRKFKAKRASRSKKLFADHKTKRYLEVQQLITMDDDKMAWRVIWCPLSNFHGDVDMGKMFYHSVDKITTISLVNR